MREHQAVPKLHEAFDTLLTPGSDDEPLPTDEELKAIEEEFSAEAQATGYDDSLADLLAESLTLQVEKDAGKAYRKQLQRAKATGVSQAEIEILRAKRAEWEAKWEWEPQALCLLIKHSICECGRVHEHAAGYYLYCTHRTQANTRRWTAVVKGQRVPAGLPKRVVSQVQTERTPVCLGCAPSQQFDIYTSDYTFFDGGFTDVTA